MCEPECEETHFDTRGDCCGTFYTYPQVENRYGKVAGSSVVLCGQHGRMARRRGDVGKR